MTLSYFLWGEKYNESWIQPEDSRSMSVETSYHSVLDHTHIMDHLENSVLSGCDSNT